MIMPMLVNLTNIISLHIRDRLIKFEEQSSTKSINITHILKSIKYSNPFYFLIYFTLSFLFSVSPMDIKTKN
jgi:hypothetical protein